MVYESLSKERKEVSHREADSVCGADLSGLSTSSNENGQHRLDTHNVSVCR